MPSFYRPSGNGCADRVPILGITFLRIATTNKPGAINPSISFCLFGLNFSQGIITLVSPAYVHRSIKWWPHYRRSHDGSVSFRTQFGERRIRNSDRPVNPGFATPLLHYADDLHRHRLRRQAIFLLLLTLHKLFIMQHFFNSYYYYYPRSALFFVHRKMIQPDYIL